MKKLVTCVVAIFAALVLMVPQAGAFADTEILSGNTVKNSDVMGAIGDGNIGIQTNGAVKDNTFNTGSATVGDIDNSNKQTMIGGHNATSLFGDANTGLINENDLSNRNRQDQDQEQDQEQDQDQAQGQGQAQEVSIDFGESYNPRQLPIGTEINYPGMPAYFGPATNQPNYMKAEVITMFKRNFNRAEVEALLSSHSGLARLRMRVNVFTGDVPSKDRAADDAVLVHLKKPKGNFAPVGYITIEAKTNKRDSVDVFYAALEEALNTLEVEEVLLVGEGARNVLKSWGAGIGFSYTQAFINDGNNSGDASGGSGTGGTGVSWGEAGYVAKPWMQIILLNNLDVKTKHVVK